MCRILIIFSLMERERSSGPTYVDHCRRTYRKFSKRGWKKSLVKKSKILDFSQKFSNCLSWPIFQNSNFFYFSFHILRSMCRMFIIFSLTQRTRFNVPSRYADHNRGTRRKYSKGVWNKCFQPKNQKYRTFLINFQIDCGYWIFKILRFFGWKHFFQTPLEYFLRVLRLWSAYENALQSSESSDFLKFKLRYLRIEESQRNVRHGVGKPKLHTFSSCKNFFHKNSSRRTPRPNVIYCKIWNLGKIHKNWCTEVNSTS